MNLEISEKQARFLATLEIVRRELVVFKYSYEQLYSHQIDSDWVGQLENNMGFAETLEAFVSRFSRLQDTIGDKLIPRALLMLAENLGSNLDNLNRAERLGWIDDVNEWLVARDLRNRLTHEYMTDENEFANDLLNAKKYFDLFQSVYEKFLKLAKTHCNVEETELSGYLRRK